jgi:hypothetical protein
VKVTESPTFNASKRLTFRAAEDVLDVPLIVLQRDDARRVIDGRNRRGLGDVASALDGFLGESTHYTWPR